MKHKGRAARAGRKIIFLAAVVPLLLLWPSPTLGAVLLGLWLAFGVFVLSFFRDPDPSVPADPEAIVAPAHGRVDVIDETEEPEFMGGPCRRISIFLSVFDVHVQNAPVAGRIALLKHKSGEFLNALRLDSADRNENVLVGIESGERAGSGWRCG